MLFVKQLTVKVEKPILHGIDLDVRPGEVHAIMGPNGSGKSTAGKALMGLPGYEVTGGQAYLADDDLLAMDMHERAAKGFFLGYQYPVSIPGVPNMVFLRTAVNAVRKARGEAEWSAGDFLKRAKAELAGIGFDAGFLQRGLNDGFSGGEKKRNEILQCLLLEPKIAWLDEIDSGLDIDALEQVAQGIVRLKERGCALVLVTHYQRLLNFIQPDRVHVLMDGRLVRSGGPELALQLEEQGYGWLKEQGER